MSSPLSAHHLELLRTLKRQIPDDLPVRDEFIARLERSLPELLAGLKAVYNDANLLENLLEVMVRNHTARSDSLRRLDYERLLAPDWFQRPETIAYVAYTERFAGNLRGVLDKLPYLERLGVKYLHLMPFLQPRPAPHDGGYAVMDYRAVRGDLGTMADLETLTSALHEKGISLCCDLVLNHVAQEHAWAQKARSGDAKYQAYFHTYPDRTLPDQFERTLPEVFPDFAPGNFTWDTESQRWVWTTFNTWQWDLNWSNPEVFLEFADLILWLSNRGVDIFRLDAIAFIWKRMGTTCQNLEEVHSITQALRAVVRIVSPAVIFKAEAIVAPNDLIHYLGRGAHHGLVSDTAYHNSLMVQIWSSLASRDTRLMTHALQGFPHKPRNTAWNAYLRCHDDIGWAIDDADAAAVGLNGEAHRRFLSDFYSGNFPGTFSRGLVFQENKKTGDRRISGSGASLAGLEVALERGDPRQIELSLERLLLGHALVLGFGGFRSCTWATTGALERPGFTHEPEHAPDNRWVHRPPMPWDTANAALEGRAPPHTQRMYDGITKLLEARRRTPQLHAETESVICETGNPHVFGYERPHPQGSLVGLYNFSETGQSLNAQLLLERGIWQPFDAISEQRLELWNGMVWLEPYARLWLVQGQG
ncbi:MAG: alpha-amylase [Pleurocapsa sp. SU_196_0]|nr:alpha-amylase [Pleurocapsa sp. SU_196_0]